MESLISKKSRISPFSKVIISLISFSLSLIVAEFSLRKISPGNLLIPKLELERNSKVIRQNNVRGVDPSTTFTTNRWGMRGDNPPLLWEQFRTILTLGGSTTVCRITDDKKIWTHILETNLNASGKKYWVGNAGIDGHSTNGNILLLEELIKEVKPDYAIFLIGINDLGVAFNKKSGDDDIFKSFLKEEKLKKEKSGFYYSLMYRSSLFKYLVFLKKQLFNETVYGQYNIVKFDEVEDRKDFLDKENLHYYKAIALDYLPNYRKNILKLIDICQKEKIMPVFMTQPMLYEQNEYWKNIKAFLFSNTEYLSASGLAQLMDYYNDELISVCSENKVPCIDLAAKIPHSHDYFFDSIHYTDKGNAIIGETVAEFLKGLEK